MSQVKMRLVIDVVLDKDEAELTKNADTFAKFSLTRTTDSLFQWWAEGCVYYARMTAYRWLGVPFTSDRVKLVGFRPVTTAPPSRGPNAV